VHGLLQQMPRTKTYSGESGYVYQYHFEGERDYPDGKAYLFCISVAGAPPFVTEIRIRRTSTDPWELSERRKLTPTEHYAIAKMALFSLLDRASSPAALIDAYEVSAEEVREILRTLDI
jgi:hypothetical protein